MREREPIYRDVVLVGGGHSHVAVMKKFGMRPTSGVRLSVISREVHTPYSGMLPGYVAGHYDFDDAHIDLRPLAAFAHARLFHDSVTGIDLDRRRLVCEGRPDVAFDLLSINIGSTPNTATVPGAERHAIPVKPVGTFLEGWRRLAKAIAEEPDAERRIAVVGAGAGGVELLLSVQYRLRELLTESGKDDRALRFDLFAANDEVMTSHNRRVRRKFARILEERGVHVHTSSRVVRVGEEALETEGDAYPYDEVIWAAEASAPDWVEETGLDTDDRGFIAVDDYLRSTSHPFVFAAGDVASLVDQPRPKSGVFAVRQGPPLARNLRRAALDRPLEKAKLQKRFLSLVSTGDRYAVASRSFLALEGAWVWKWKDCIDTTWMEQWRDLPAMKVNEDDFDVTVGGGEDRAAELAELDPMRCGGCGAKVGPDLLRRVLDRLSPHHREDVLVGLNDPDDCAIVRVPDGKAALHTVDFFRAFIDDPYMLGRVAAHHALSDLWAMAATPQSALALVTIPYGLESKVEETLFQLLAGALEVLEEAEASLVGGHTAEGAELAFGLEVNGYGDPDRLLRKSGMRPGDALILAKPLGTGTIFAADMRGEAKARWVDAALASMTTSNAGASRVFLDHEATACTDVTGFGLVGHLSEMIRASDVSVTIDLSALPLIDGALECIEADITSSLQPKNERLRRMVSNDADVDDEPRYPLLFDPQTSGGLLASVPRPQIEACLTALREHGYAQAAVVGRARESEGSATTIDIEVSPAGADVVFAGES